MKFGDYCMLFALLIVLATPFVVLYFNHLEDNRTNLAAEEFCSVAIGLSDDRVVDFFRARHVRVPRASSMKTPDELVPIRSNCLDSQIIGKYRYVIEYSEQTPRDNSEQPQGCSEQPQGLVVSGLYFIGEVPKVSAQAP